MKNLLLFLALICTAREIYTAVEKELPNVAQSVQTVGANQATNPNSMKFPIASKSKDPDKILKDLAERRILASIGSFFGIDIIRSTITKISLKTPEEFPNLFSINAIDYSNPFLN